MENTQNQFDAAYRSAQPPEVRTLMDMPSDSLEAVQLRVTRGAALAAKGYTIDAPIMVYGWDPYLCMTERANLGLTWVPSALQLGLGQPGGVAEPGLVPQPGQTAYDPRNPPAGSIKVSTNLDDYPPFDPPTPPAAPAVITDPVGAQSFGNLYYSTPVGNSYPDGATFTESRGSFLKHVTVTPFGRTNYWEKIA